MWKWFAVNDAFQAVDGLNSIPVAAGEVVVGTPFGQGVIMFYFRRPGTDAADVPSVTDPFALPSERYADMIDEDQLIVSAENFAEVIDSKQRIAETDQPKVWRWMGNFGHPTFPPAAFDMAVNVANAPPAQGAGEAMFYLQRGLLVVSVFLFF